MDRSASTTCAMSDTPAGWRRHDDAPLSSLRRGTGPRMVFVHGFTQTGRSWIPVAEQFTNDHEVVLVDAPAHGDSRHIGASLSEGADLLAATCAAATYVGYSMGARLCLHLALAHPVLVRSLVLIGGTGGITNDTERAERMRADETLADQILADGVDQFLERWLSLPLFATLPASAHGIDDRRSNTALGLASSLRHAGSGTQVPLWNELHRISAPTLVIAGELDAKFSDLGHQLVSAIGTNATFVGIPGTGHAAHLEDPHAVTTALRTLPA